MYHQRKKIGSHGSGYIALTSVIICSLLLLMVTAAISATNYFSRLAILESEYKQRSSSLAEACVDYALAQIEINPANYSGGEAVVPVGKNNCSVGTVTPLGNSWPKTIQVQGVYPTQGSEQSFTNLKVTINSNLNIISWEEVAN